MRYLAIVALIISLCALPASAQLVGIVTPSPARALEAITLTLWDSHGVGALFLDGCIVNQVTAASPTGPVVWTPKACPDVLIPVLPHGCIDHRWTPPPEMLDVWGGRTYYLRVSYSVQGGPLQDHFFAATWNSDPLAPTLSGDTVTALGMAINLWVSAPACDFSAYVVAASMSTDEGLPLFGGYLHLALDLDSLFMASLIPNDPHFTNFAGNLDAWGNSPPITLHVPDDPEMLYMGFYAQALIYEPFTTGQVRVRAPELTNVISRIIRP